MRQDLERLQDILSAIGKIEQYTDRGKPAFEQDELIQVWVIYHLQIIGEAANALSDSLCSQYSDVPWARVVGFRNVVVHEYFRVDLNLVWAVVERNLPDLKGRVEQILRDVQGNGEWGIGSGQRPF